MMKSGHQRRSKRENGKKRRRNRKPGWISKTGLKTVHMYRHTCAHAPTHVCITIDEASLLQTQSPCRPPLRCCALLAALLQKLARCHRWTLSQVDVAGSGLLAATSLCPVDRSSSHECTGRCSASVKCLTPAAAARLATSSPM